MPDIPEHAPSNSGQTAVGQRLGPCSSSRHTSTAIGFFADLAFVGNYHIWCLSHTMEHTRSIRVKLPGHLPRVIQITERPSHMPNNIQRYGAQRTQTR
jgi:hypothetical protein